MDVQYGGVLGLIGCTTVLIRQWIQGDSIEHIMWMAIGGLITYCFIGFLIGKVADFIVRESVRITIANEVEAQRESATTTQQT